VENSLSAARAAIARGFAIECDVQRTSDGEAIVFHDYTLERLTNRTGRVDHASAAELAATRLRRGTDHIPSLPDFLGLIAGQVPIICEIKSRFDGDLRLAQRVAHCTAAYSGPICIESFDPVVMTYLSRNRPALGLEHVPLGMVAQSNYDNAHDEWAHLDAQARHALAHFLHFPETRPDFISYCVNDLPNAVPALCRAGLGLPVTSWTVRTLEQHAIAKQHADQVVFEGEIFD
jgi:glycerophosphoryl diester phosphodiesterase